jgi:hypothetical protein
MLYIYIYINLSVYLPIYLFIYKPTYQSIKITFYSNLNAVKVDFISEFQKILLAYKQKKNSVALVR